MDADRTPSLLQRCWVVDGKQPSGKIKVLYDSAVQKLRGEVGLTGTGSLLDAANKSEWHNITRPEALAAQARAASAGPAGRLPLKPGPSQLRPGGGAAATRTGKCGARARRPLRSGLSLGRHRRLRLSGIVKDLDFT